MSGFDIEVPKEDWYDRYFSVFDFEAMVVKTPSKTVEQGKILHATHLDPGKVQRCFARAKTKCLFLKNLKYTIEEKMF